MIPTNYQHSFQLFGLRTKRKVSRPNLQLDKGCSTSHCASSGVRIANHCQTVGKLLQDILDLLATASSDTERKILDDWKALLSQYTVVYDVAHATGMADMEHMFLTLKGRSLRNGAALERYFRYEGKMSDNVVALPTFRTSLRLYCLRLSFTLRLGQNGTFGGVCGRVKHESRR